MGGIQMDTTAATFTIYFEGPFWVGIYERTQNGSLEVCRVVFGAEPKDYEVYDFLLKYWGCMQFSPPVAAGQAPAEIRNPKRARRTAKQSMTHKGTGTKAQQDLQMQRELGKQERKENRKKKSEEEKARRFALRQQRKKEKHRGR